MKLLVVGNGGREHALAWKFAQSESVEKVYVAPGNAGTALEPRVENIDIGVLDIDALVDFAVDNQIDLTVIGPEAPLVAGIVDRFNAANLPCLGPTAAAARLEGSKSFAKDFMSRHGIPTACYQSFTDAQSAVEYLQQQSFPVVIKADGLAAGKGVVIAEDKQLAETTVEDMLSGNRFGDAGSRVVIESFLSGEEASFICLVDGNHVLPMASSQDHKAAQDGDQGPNTGGMGAYSPSLLIDSSMTEKILQQVILPVVHGMAAEGATYVGFLYAGLMIGEDQIPNVVEFNCRFGDPEAQPVLTRLESDFAQHCIACVEGRLDKETALWNPEPCLGVVMASAGYPGDYATGMPIEGLTETQKSVKVFHSGTRQQDEQILTSGGRVLCVCSSGSTVANAQKNVYQAVDKIYWDGVWSRRDIGYRAVAREQEAGQKAL